MVENVSVSAEDRWRRADPRQVSKSLSPLSEEELRSTAYHEAGHTVVAYVLLGVVSDSLSITDATENTGVTNIWFDESLRQNLSYIEEWIVVCAAGARQRRFLLTDRNL